MNKKFIILFAGIFLILTSLNIISSFTIQSVTPSYINRSIPTILNFTINGTGDLNITQINITFPMEAKFYLGGNGSDAVADSFINTTTSFRQIILSWTNSTGLIRNNTKSFWFNATIMNIQSSFFTNFTIDVAYTSGSNTQNSYNFVGYFAFSGFTRNETGGNESNVNISLYEFVEGRDGPPTERLAANILSDANGSFSFSSINGSVSLYTLKMVKYANSTGDCTSYNSTNSCNATKIGAILPPFPPLMYYPTYADLPFAFEFMRPPSLNGTNFYMQPAATLRLYTNNKTDSSNGVGQLFGYQVIDQISGFPIESNAKTNVSTKDIVVPIDRNLTVMFSRFPGFPGSGSGFLFSNDCNGMFLNDTHCPTPPMSNSTLGTLSQGQILIINQSLVTSSYKLYGCINISSGNINAPFSSYNITEISLKMVPWPGFVPPTRGDMGNINLGRDVRYDVNISTYGVNNTISGVNCNGTLAFYNISVMGSSAGLNYMVEIYAKNSSSSAGNPGATAWNIASFKNVTITSNTYLNLTMYRLAGGYTTAGSVNTSMIKVAIVNSTGGAVTNQMNANVKVKNPEFGTNTYIIESMTNGVFYIPILNNSNWAKIMVFAQDSPPREINLNLSNITTSVFLITMSDGNGVGMKRINESGGMEMLNSTKLNSTNQINMRFLRNTASCNVREAADSCALTTATARSFNPLTALVAGKINMEMKIPSTNVTLNFVNFDMMSAKQPPMESIMNDQASGNSTANQAWQFGSFAPVNTYDYVIISMPYSDSAINDSAQMNLSTPLFYDENWNVVWNSSRGDTSANLTDDFIDYNSSSLYRGYLNSGGLNCSKADPNLNITPCFVNTTTNMIYMRIPHFSGVGPNVLGNAISSTSSASTTTSPSSSDVGISSYWVSTLSVSDADFEKGYTKELFIKNRLKIIFDGKTHYVGVVGLTSTTATINVSSIPQQATFSIGDTRKFKLDEDNFYDLSVKLNSIKNSKANFTILKINEEATPEKIAEEQKKEESATGQTPIIPLEKPETKLNITLLWTIIGIVAIIIIAIFVVRNKKKRRHLLYGY